LTASGVVPNSSRVTDCSGIIVSGDVLTAAPVDAEPRLADGDLVGALVAHRLRRIDGAARSGAVDTMARSPARADRTARRADRCPSAPRDLCQNSGETSMTT
jgi:hypothetical protein